MGTTTLYDLLTGALRADGLLYEGQTPSASKIQNAQDAMNLTLDELSDIILYASVTEQFNLVAGKGTYAIGPSGDFDTSRPVSVVDCCFVRDLTSGVDYPVPMLNQGQFNAISLKNYTLSIPQNIFYDPQYPLGQITFYFIPDKEYLFNLVSVKPLSEITSLTEAINLPPEFRNFIKWMTAKALAADYPEVASQPSYQLVVLPHARRSLATIQRIAAVNNVGGATLDTPLTGPDLRDWRGAFLAGA